MKSISQGNSQIEALEEPKQLPIRQGRRQFGTESSSAKVIANIESLGEPKETSSTRQDKRCFHAIHRLAIDTPFTQETLPIKPMKQGNKAREGHWTGLDTTHQANQTRQQVTGVVTGPSSQPNKVSGKRGAFHWTKVHRPSSQPNKVTGKRGHWTAHQANQTR